MTKHCELIDSVPEIFTSRKTFRFHASSPSAKCENMADPVQLSRVGGGYVDKAIE
jgi:hypothetical protein